VDLSDSEAGAPPLQPPLQDRNGNGGAQDGLTCPGLPLPCYKSPRPPNFNDKVSDPGTAWDSRDRLRLLGPPGYRRGLWDDSSALESFKAFNSDIPTFMY
jgi:hypothetical protein